MQSPIFYYYFYIITINSICLYIKQANVNYNVVNLIVSLFYFKHKIIYFVIFERY